MIFFIIFFCIIILWFELYIYLLSPISINNISKIKITDNKNFENLKYKMNKNLIVPSLLTFGVVLLPYYLFRQA